MTLAPLDSLVKAGLLKNEPPDQMEFDGLLKSGSIRLRDAGTTGLSSDSRFDLA